MIRGMLFTIFAAALLTGAALAGLSEVLGAHPWWAVKVALIGVGAGFVPVWLLICFDNMRPWAMAPSLVGMVLAFVAAARGKAEFAASFAADHLAGQMWYFGWIAVYAFALALLAQILARLAAGPKTAH